MSDRHFPDKLIAWTESVWGEAGVAPIDEQAREMAYVAGRTVLQTMFYPYAEKNGGIELLKRFIEALATVPGWDPPDMNTFLDAYDEVVTHFESIVEPFPNTGEAKTELHEAVDEIIAEGPSDNRAIVTDGTTAELLIDGALRSLRPTWVEDVRQQFGAAA